LLNAPAEIAIIDGTSRQVIEPVALAVIDELQEWIHDAWPSLTHRAAMASPIDETFVASIDSTLLDQGVPLHGRPFHVAIAYMRSEQIEGDFLSPTIWTPLMEIYHQLYPSGDFAVPAVLIGGVAFRDQFYRARVSLGYGRISVDPLKCIDIGPQELEAISRQHPDQVWRAVYSVGDLWDFGYGVDDLRRENAEVTGHLENARAAIVATAQTLSQSGEADNVVQSACLTAELSMKGVLAKLGVDEARRRKLGGNGHGLAAIAAALIEKVPGPSDARLVRVAGEFPNYVNSRYVAHGLKRIDLVELAMKAQFVAADAVRRVTDRDFVSLIEQDPRNTPRLFP
jgi:hypothetical protein